MLARFGSAAAPESRHLIFVMPFFLVVLATGRPRCPTAGPPGAPRSSSPSLRSWRSISPGAGLRRPSSIAASRRRVWPHGATPRLARADVALGRRALRLRPALPGGLASGGDLRARSCPVPIPAWLARSQRAEPLGRGLWVFDASDTGNPIRRLEVPNRPPVPRTAFETRTFGPFLVVRTVAPTGDVRSYLRLARRAQLAGKALSMPTRTRTS